MAPSITEVVTPIGYQIQEKFGSISFKEAKKDNPVDEAAPAVQLSSSAFQTQHKTPLKLSGALDHFESFDVTPAIGREFVGVNLAAWLRAPNSDELLRDLAITST
jgi:hypothetical protein